MIYRTISTYCLLLGLMLLAFSMEAQSTKDTVALNGNLEAKQQESLGLGTQLSISKFSTLDFFAYYQTKSSLIWQFSYGTSFKYDLNYRDADGFTSTVDATWYYIGAGVNVLLSNPETAIYLQSQVIGRFQRSEKVSDWVDFDHLPYEKRFDHHYDVDMYGLQMGLRLFPKITENVRLNCALLFELYQFSFPDRRQSDPLYTYPVRRNFLKDNASTEAKYLFTANLHLGISFVIF